MSMKERFEGWRALWQWLTAEADDEEYLDAAMVICDRCGGRTDADCAACPVKTGRPLHLQMEPDTALTLMRGLTPMKILNAAIEDLKCFSECEQCAYVNTDSFQACNQTDIVCDECSDHTCPCYGCEHGSKWVWRGPRQTEGGSGVTVGDPITDAVTQWMQLKLPEPPKKEIKNETT